MQVLCEFIELFSHISVLIKLTNMINSLSICNFNTYCNFFFYGEINSTKLFWNKVFYKNSLRKLKEEIQKTWAIWRISSPNCLENSFAHQFILDHDATNRITLFFITWLSDMAMPFRRHWSQLCVEKNTTKHPYNTNIFFKYVYSQKTLHSLPSWASYGASFVSS